MKKTLLRTAALLMLALSLTACAAQSESMTVPSPTVNSTTEQPNASSSPAADMTDMPMTQPDMPVGAADPDAARRAAESLEDELEQLSEVDEADVLIAGQNAVVALKFDSQYQAGITDRIREMVRDRMDGVLSGVTRLEVTDDPAMIRQIGTLTDQMENATDLTEIEQGLEQMLDSLSRTLSPTLTDGPTMS